MPLKTDVLYKGLKTPNNKEREVIPMNLKKMAVLLLTATCLCSAFCTTAFAEINETLIPSTIEAELVKGMIG